MKRLTVCLLLLASHAVAQEVKPILDADSADVTAIITKWRGQILFDQMKIADLQQRLDAMTKERDALKTAPPAADETKK